MTATAGVAAGARLLVTDYAPESLALCRYHALANAGREPDALQINWRAAPEALFARAGTGFPIVLAADVLYESRDVEPLLELVERLVAPGGLLWLAEPGRAVARRFVAAILERGWTSEEQAEHSGPWPDPRDEGVIVTVYRLKRPGA